MAAGDELFKMPMRHWLVKMVDSREFEGLEWLDASKTKLRLPWMKKDYPGWRSCEKLVKAWASHQGRTEEEGKKTDFSTLKANFRNALHKSEDFEEDNAMSQLDNQTDNFKVYKRLSREEVGQRKEAKKRERAKKRKMKLQNSTKSKLVCAEQNIDDGKMKSIEKDDLDFALWSPEENTPQQQALNETTIPDKNPVQADSFQQGLASYDLSTTPNMQQFPNEHYDVNFNPYSQQYTSSYNAHQTMANVGPVYTPQVQNLPPIAAIQQCTSDYPTISNGTTYDNFSMPYSTGDHTILQNSVIQRNPLDMLIRERCLSYSILYKNLAHCDITVTYNSVLFLRDTCKNTQKGYRIFYGNEENLKTVLRMAQGFDEGLIDYEYPTIRLPHAPSEMNVLQEVLNKTDLGLVFRYDSLSHSFLVKRLCQSQVFYLDPHAEPYLQVPIKMNRQEEVCVFSYQKYFECLGFGNPHYSQVIEPTIYISIGSKKNLQTEHRSNGGIKLTIRLCALQLISEEMISSGNLSLYFSRATAEEEMLRQMRGVSINGE